MSDDPVCVDCGLRAESVEQPRSPKKVKGNPRKLEKLAAVLVVLLFGLMIVVVIEDRATEPSSPREAAVPVWDGRLADVTGEDAIYRLEATQAAMRREVALLGRWVREGVEALPEEAEVTLALASLDAGQERLDAHVARLEADQLRLREVVMAYQLELARLAQQLIQQGQVLESLRAWKGD